MMLEKGNFFVVADLDEFYVEKLLDILRIPKNGSFVFDGGIHQYAIVDRATVKNLAGESFERIQ